MKSDYAVLPDTFKNPTPACARCCSYNLARPGGVRRKLALPNPVHFVALCNEVVLGWETISVHFATSHFSLSVPVDDAGRTRAVVPKDSHSVLTLHRATLRAGFKYTLRADISECYHSIYTHGIAWALHGKATAKASRGDRALLGNRLDERQRAIQERQSVGVPVGPDTSLVISEIVLCAADSQFSQRVPRVVGYRHYDDYRFFFADLGSAESALGALQDALSEYELRLNPEKTRIDTSPLRIEDDTWAAELGTFRFDLIAQKQARDLIRYFDKVAEFVRSDPKGNVTKYALARLRDVNVVPENWELFQSLLCQAVVVEPSAIQSFAEVLAKALGRGLRPAAEIVGGTLNRIIKEHATRHHDHEVSWSIWAILAFGFRVEAETTAELSKTDNSVVALLALDAAQKGALDGVFDTRKIESRMTVAELYEDQWLLSYEARARDWIASTGGGNHLEADPNFRFLKDRGVNFYVPVVGPDALLPRMGIVVERYPARH